MLERAHTVSTRGNETDSGLPARDMGISIPLLAFSNVVRFHSESLTDQISGLYQLN